MLAAGKARVDAVWEQMNKGISNKALNDLLKKPSKPSSTVKKTQQKSSSVRSFPSFPLMFRSYLEDKDSWIESNPLYFFFPSNFYRIG